MGIMHVVQKRSRPRTANSARLFKSLAAALQSEAEAGSLRIGKTARGYRDLQKTLESALLPAGHPLGVEQRKGSQSKQFMVQILPRIQAFMRGFPRGHQFDVLDVGPGAGHGANLLGSLYGSLELGYRARVTTVDISDRYHGYIRVFCRFIASHRVTNIFDLNETYDIVTASHVIEHVKEPLTFCRRLQELSSGVVFVCAPYKERQDILTKGHRNIIDDAFLGALGAEDIELVESPAWGQFLEPRYKMFIARLPGLATPKPEAAHPD